MKSMKKILAIALALVMIMSLGLTALAAGDGSITIKNATKGHTYTAYKVFDATYTGTGEDAKVSYKTPADNASLLDEDLFGWSEVADADGNISVWALETASEADIIDWVEENYDKFGGEAIPGVFDAENSTVTFSNLDYGYYYITSTLGTTVTIDSAVPSATVYDKNVVTPTDPEKTIVSVDGIEPEDGTVADAHVGSVVEFEVTAKTANWTGEKEQAVITEKWELIDTPTNMEIDESTIVVKFNGTELDDDAYTASIDSSTGKLTINVPMVDEDGNSIFDAPVTEDDENGLIPIEITYKATITEEAAGEPAENEVGGPPVLVYTYAFQVVKVDGEEEPLPGAQFELWSAKGAQGDAAALTFTDNNDGTYTYDPTGAGVTTLDMTENTTISILGLDNSWSYILKEITVPEGYNQAEDITIEGSSLTKVEKDTDTSIESKDLHQEVVENKAGSVLPSTGGIGTTLFYVFGTLLVLGAGVVLVTKRRVSE